MWDLLNIAGVALLMIVVLTIAEVSGPEKALKVIGAGVLIAVLVLAVTT